MKKQLPEKTFDVQSIEIYANYKKAFDFIAEPKNLPLWTKAFTKVEKESATMVTENGEINIKLETIISKDLGIIDWVMTMPDGSIGKAFSRISENGKTSIYTFTLLAPPVPLEELEGTLKIQKLLLAQELMKLKSILEVN
ncbi:hypothetical protein [Flavivirga sp. 57AJ16]|uniref:hypothetical protein n=1 Tax=Flavivirga sp. 57AJ16 TaxID=3025307 RepID=UPI0023660E28|nr:hypothetical protein [Flavivirga sp. 57AJ16]MDD7886201.1 hypothetical protein [Flavivirga sp. 57AJ16]